MRLPYFPLHVVLFPHLPLPIHVFEQRYRAMARDLLAEGSPYEGRFVVSMLTEGAEVLEGRPGRAAPVIAQRIGTIAEVRSAEQLPDGRWVLLAVGVARAELSEIESDGSYATIEATALPEVEGSGAAALLPGVQAALDRYLASVKRFVAIAASSGSTPMEPSEMSASLDAVLKPIRLPDEPLAASYAIGGLLQVELTRKQHLLELPDAATRLTAELALLQRESQLLAQGALPPIAAGDLRYHRN